MAFQMFGAAALERAHISEGFAFPPYKVENFPIGSCVTNKNGFNCLSFKNGVGAKFTSKEIAVELCNKWNFKV